MIDSPVEFKLAEFIEQMHEAEEEDTESAHITADEILLDALRLLGQVSPHEATVEKLIEVYNSIHKWYA